MLNLRIEVVELSRVGRCDQGLSHTNTVIHEDKHN